MSKRGYGQYCGLARAAEVLGQRWTLLILRDLLVGPRRYSDIAGGLPGIPSNLLSTRLKELEDDGLIIRRVRSSPDRSVVYTVTERGAALRPALDALSLWGAATMDEPREGEVVTTASLISALRVAAEEGEPLKRPRAFTITVGNVSVHALTSGDTIDIGEGPAGESDLVIEAGPGFRDLLAGELSPRDALAEGLVSVEGDPALLDDFVTVFRIPYDHRGGSRPTHASASK